MKKRAKLGLKKVTLRSMDESFLANVAAGTAYSYAGENSCPQTDCSCGQCGTVSCQASACGQDTCMTCYGFNVC